MFLTAEELAEVKPDYQCYAVVHAQFEDAPRLCRRPTYDGHWYCNIHERYARLRYTAIDRCAQCGKPMMVALPKVVTQRDLDEMEWFVENEIGYRAAVPSSFAEDLALAGSSARYQDRGSARCSICADSASVYVIRADRWIKIGIAKDPSRRIKELVTGCPIKPEIAWQSRQVERSVAYRVEKMAHEHFHHAHSNGEWFELSADDAIAVLLGMIGN
jgi:hypothetical protein